MKTFEDMRLTTKAIVPVLAMAIAFAALLVWSFEDSVKTSATFNRIIAQEDVAALKMSLFSKSATTVPYAAYRLTAYSCTKGEAASCNTALSDFKAGVATALANIDDAVRIDADVSEHGAAMSEFRSRFNGLVAEVQSAVDLGLKDDEAGIAVLKGVDPKFIQLNTDVAAFNDKSTVENMALAQGVADAARLTSIVMLTVGLVTVLLGIVVSAWLSVTQVSRPLVTLGATMRALAGGNLTIEVSGQTRADEIGGMSKAVQVFKENAFKALGQEKEVEQTRRLAETERKANERMQASAAEQLSLVVNSIAAGMERLANGDLVFRLDTRFAPEYEKLRGDFNNAMEKLQDTLKVVSSNASAIQSGTGEISSAADDLSKAHRAAGREPRGDRRGARRDHGDRAQDRGGRQSRPPGGRHGQNRCGAVRASGAPGGRGHERHREVVGADQPDHRRDR